MRTLASNRQLYSGYIINFNNSMQTYMNVGTLGTMGQGLKNGLYMNCNIQINKQIINNTNLFGLINQNGQQYIEFSPLLHGTLYQIASNDSFGNGFLIQFRPTTFLNGSLHNFVLNVNPNAKTGSLVIDGSVMPVSGNGFSSSYNYSNFDNNFFVANYNNGGVPFSGALCNLENFAIGLSPTNIFGTYSFSSTTGTIIQDTSGHNNNGTLTGFTNDKPLYVHGFNTGPRFTTAINRTLSMGRNLHP